MIDDSMIKRLAAQTGLVDNFEIGSDTDRQKHLDWECVTKFARACYAAGREDQRESDAALCDKDMHLALRTNQTGVAMGMKVLVYESMRISNSCKQRTTRSYTSRA